MGAVVTDGVFIGSPTCLCCSGIVYLDSVKIFNFGDISVAIVLQRVMRNRTIAGRQKKYFLRVGYEWMDAPQKCGVSGMASCPPGRRDYVLPSNK